ncbi:hypothetical protein DL770_008810 [Monosporascus sp. CRB-9-2]|nr:hypothetical protein DL770_008810 [Monosporascus sp. CRB-9-2]
MEPAPPETKRPRLLTGSSWSAGTPQHGVSLPHPTSHHSAHAPYQPQHPYSRPPEPPPPPPAQHHPDDRRQHEPEFYPPMQDPHRQPPPPSPAHPPYPAYPARDPVVKKDPGEEAPLPHLRRPNSTGNAADGFPPGSHGPPPHHLAQHPEDPRRPMNFDNGPPMAHSPTIYRPPPQSYPPPTPVPHHPQYDGGVYGHPPPSQPIYPAQLEIQSAKRKAQRASQVRIEIPQLKAKCDETKPCKNCKEKGVKCNYREPTVKQPDKATSDILEMLAFMKDEMTSGFAAMRKLEQRLSGVEGTLKHINSTEDLKIESVEEGGRLDPQRSSPALTNKEEAAEESTSSPTATLVGPPLTVDEAQATLREADDDEMEDPPGPPVEPGKPAMPPIHTTLAGLLLKWGPIKRMVHHHLEAEKIHHVEEFPIRQEMQRGMIRVFGFGEGFDQEIRAAEYSYQGDQVMTDIHDDYSDVASPAPAGEAWGQLGGLSPAPGVNYKGGVINMDGNPDYDPTKVWDYVKSFKDNILNMHPIIIPKELDAMVKLFLETIPHSKPKQAKTSSIAKFVNPSVPPFPEAGTKRKRSPAAEEPNPSVTFQKPGRPYRSIHSALVLLVLALGKICLHKDRIPDVVRDLPDAPTANSPSIRNGFPASPLQGSPPGPVSQSQSSGLPSPRENERGLLSRRPSIQGAPPVTKGVQSKRNFDVIPGLEYFALATDIIGSHIAGHNLKHVYVLILAGLYHGQLGRIIESWSYINLASTRLHAILRPSLDRLSRLKEDIKSIETRRDNQLAFAFWTCLQLESDILAELPLAQSPIMQHEDQMPYPNLVLANSQGFSERVLQGYSAQLYLRKKLNQVHNLLYDQRRSQDPRQLVEDPEIVEGIRRIQAELRDARNIWVPQLYRWNDDDPPAGDILSARLRAKYWGSQVIIYRVFIRSILEGETSPAQGYAGRPPHANDWASPVGVEVDGRVVSMNVDRRTLESARLGIHALIESTRAFHGIDSNERLIITNVFGTAHAQWGNLVILAACFKHPLLSKYINVEVLSDLFSRTIKFFDMVATPSSALMADRNILVGLAKDLELARPDEFDPRTNSSFSSGASGGPLPPMQNPGDNYVPSSPAVYAPSHFAPPPPHPNS